LNIFFAGTPDFAANHLDALLESSHRVVGVVTQPDKPGKRGRKPIPSPVKTLALTHAIPIIQPPRLTLNDLPSPAPDIMIVVAFGQILRPPVLEYPRHGCINVHASLLPRWRGAAPIQRAILAGDDVTGVSIMRMDKGLDTGDVLMQSSVPISLKDNAGSLTEKLSVAGTKLLIQTLDQLSSLPVQQQDDALASYASKITKQEAQLDWGLSAVDLSRIIRAFNPQPVAYSLLGELRVKIWQAEPINEDSNQPPGEILALTKQGVRVSCGSGVLLLKAIQLPIGKGSILGGADIRNARGDLFAPGQTFRSRSDNE
jgi:methionyl-tRNA formyltransferase